MILIKAINITMESKLWVKNCQYHEPQVLIGPSPYPD